VMTVYQNRGRYDSSNTAVEGDTVIRYEKGVTDPALTYIDYGLSMLSKGVFACCDEENAFDLAALYTALAAKGEMAGFRVRRRFYEIGSRAGIDELNVYLSKKAAKEGEER